MMIRTIAPLVLLTLSASLLPLRADLLVYEPFDYPAGGLNAAGGSTDFGFSGNWSANATTEVVASDRGYGSLPTTGGSVGNLSGGQNRPGGTRAIDGSIAGAGLLADGRELWFSAVMGYDAGGNRTNSRLALSLGSTGFNNANFSYVLDEAGATGLGVTLGRFGGNGRIVATQFRDGSVGGTSGFADNVFGDRSGTVVLPGSNAQVDVALVVGRFAWGAASDTLDIFLPDAGLSLGAVHSTLTVDVNQSLYDTISFKRGDQVVIDEFRFGASANDVLGVIPEPSSIGLTLFGMLGLLLRRRWS